jgi:hypothetical protein
MKRRRLWASLVALLVALGVAPTAVEAAWTAPLTLSAAGQDGLGPQVDVDADGDAVVIWHRFGGVNERVQARAISSAGVLSSVQTLSAAGQDAFAPQVAVDPDGDAIFTWERYDGTHTRIQARARSSAGVLSPVQTLSAVGQDAVDPQVGIDADGDAVFTWERFDGTNWRVQARARSAAGVLSPVQTLSAAGQPTRRPQVAVNDVGDAVFAWERFGGPYWWIEARARHADAVLSPVQTLFSPQTPNQYSAFSPQVAIDVDGNAVFAWGLDIREFRGRSRILARARSAAGELSPVQFLSAPGGSGGGAFQPQVAVDGSGNAVFTWARVDGYVGPPPVIEARARSAAGTLSPVQIISDYDASSPQVALDDAGDAVFAWWFFETDPDCCTDPVQARTRSVAGALGPVETVSPGAPDASGQFRNPRPQVAVGAIGDAVLTWQRFDGTTWRVQAAVGP